MDAINIARPANFVVDRNGIVTWMYIGSSQTDRAPMEQVLQEAQKAKG
jgi:hypothetical protein